ncbi:hypothetical protein PFTANZ_06497, partial [Plasmodium falciparum Tanzania (2000708)]
MVMSPHILTMCRSIFAGSRNEPKTFVDAIQNCRGENGTERYCDLNGFDCTKTARGENKRFSNDECYKCSVACNPFVPWIDNQQKEFEKQKNKYAEEIQKKDQTKTTITTANGKTTINNLYVKDFYDALNEHYPTVDKFLQKLNDEAICKSELKVGEEKADPVDFTGKNYGKTFYRTKYCRACPWCGVKEKKVDGIWEDRQDTACASAPTISFDESNATEIHLLSTEKGKSNILDKYSKLCENGVKETETWKCYYEEKNEYDDSDKDYCVLQDKKKNTQDNKKDTQDRRIMPYVTFFNVWIDE